MGNWILTGLIVGVVVIIILAKFYQRSSKDVAFVRTGLGGQKVVLTGGKLSIPIVHQITPVNMNTLRLDVKRIESNALVTKDRMRVDLHVVFYVRVIGDKAGVALAAQTLGSRTLNQESIQNLLEGKFVDSMRSITAEMTLDELHEQGKIFVTKISAIIQESIAYNGLELESVSLNTMDQSAKEFFNSDNTFDAEGLVKITRDIEKSRKTRNEIEKEAELVIHQTNLEAEEKGLTIKYQSEVARLNTESDIAKSKSEQMTEISNVQAIQASEAKEIEISENERIEKIRLTSEQILRQEKISTEKNIRSAEIEKTNHLEIIEIESQTALKVAEEERERPLLSKKTERALESVNTSEAKAKAVSADEKINTSRETAIAEREKLLSLLKATRMAEEKAIAVRLDAEAEKDAATNIANATEIIANAKAAALRVEQLAKADGLVQLNEAANILSAAQVEMKIKLQAIDKLPEIIKESVKPIENIDGIKIVDIGGLGLNSDGGSSKGKNKSKDDGDLMDKAVSGALRYRAQAPVVDALLKDVGLTDVDGDGLEDIINGKSSFLLDKKLPPKNKKT
jgi:uncharacterized membrane protein YqiK